MNRAEKRIKSDNLDLEFKKILSVIREHIPRINSNAYLLQCRLWLEKLSNPNVNKVLRNLYLVDLCGQIQKNKLLPPFNEAPPTGSLKSLTNALMTRKSCKLLLQDIHRRKSRLLNLQNSITHIKENDATETNLLCPHNTETWGSVGHLQSEKTLEDTPENIQDEQNTPVLIGRQEQSAVKIFYQKPIINNSFDCGEPISNVQKKNEVKTGLTNNELTQTKNGPDEDSWSDLTDGSSNAEFPLRKEKKLKAQIIRSNNNIHRNADKPINYFQNKMQIGRPFSCQVPILKCYNVEESNFKSPKDNNNYITEDWKNTIDSLQLRLSEMTYQNNELKAVIQKLEIEIDDVRNKNMEETDQAIKMFENLQFDEIVKLKEIHDDKIFQLEKSFQVNIEKLENNCEVKINKLTTNYEHKITELNKQNEVVTRIRDNEICRLTEVIQQQCARITDDISALQTQVSSCSCDKKLLLLKKCISKMDKLFQRSEKEYLRQIDRLRQELEIKNTALQIQLKIQKAELIAETSSERQEEFEKVLNALEIKYIKMLEMHEDQIMEIKKQDDAKIQSLKELLSKHGITCDEDNV